MRRCLVSRLMIDHMPRGGQRVELDCTTSRGQVRIVETLPGFLCLQCATLIIGKVPVCACVLHYAGLGSHLRSGQEHMWQPDYC